MPKTSKSSPEWNRVQRSIVAEDGGECMCCGNTQKLRVHHIIPESDGGPSLDRGNLVTLCQVCEKHVHKPFLRFTQAGAICGGPHLSAASIYNVCILREMRLTRSKPSKRDTFRAAFLRMRATNNGSAMTDRQLSKRSRNLGNILDNHLDPDRMPWVLDFDDYEVEVRLKAEACPDKVSDG